MKTINKLLVLAFFLTALPNCKVKIDGSGDIVIQEAATEIKKITYYDGGWHAAPGQPNFRAHLILELRSDLNVRLTLEQPECTVTKITSDDDFLELASLIENAELFLDNSGAQIVDVGNEYIQTYDHFMERDDLFLKKSDNSNNKLHFTSPVEIRNKVNAIINKFPCI